MSFLASGSAAGRIFSTLPCDASVADSPPHAGVVARCPDCHGCPGRTSAQLSCTNVHAGRRKDERVREDDAYRAAAMYYLQDQTMEVIAGTLGVSRSTVRSEEHTSELQSRGHIVCSLLLEKQE